IFTEGISTQKVGTKEFAAAVIARLGQKPGRLKAVTYAAKGPGLAAAYQTADTSGVKAELTGFDIYVEWKSRNPEQLAKALAPSSGDGLNLQMISNRGVKVWPEGMAETFCTDSFRCRYMGDGGKTEMKSVLGLMHRINDLGIQIVKTEALRNFDGQPGYTLAQGQ